MLKNITIDIIIPVYNECENIKKTLDALLQNIKNIAASIQINIVYDFDEDNTLPIINKIKNAYAIKINLIKNPVRGVLNAIKTGFVQSNADYVLVTMADMSDDYEILPEMIKKAQEGYDIICASRYMKGGKLYGGPFLKQFLSRWSGLSLHFLTGIPTHDITNSYKLYKQSMINSIQIESDGGFEIGIEITSKAYIMGYKIIEIASRWWDRTEGQSKFKLMKWLPKYLKWYFYLTWKFYKNKLKSFLRLN